MMLSAFSQIPPEIWREIFHATRILDRLCISETCRLWREIACSDCLLWSSIDCTILHHALVRLCVARSQDAPLSVIAYHEIPKILVDQSYRWKVLNYTPSTPVDILSTMNSTNLTALETLAYTGPMKTLAGIQGQFKNLKNLRTIMHATSQNICFLSSSSTSIQFHNLITLDLTLISPDALNEAIPPITLEHLQIFKFRCTYPSEVTLDFINALRLPSLRSFELVLHTPGYSLHCDPSTIGRSLILHSQCTRTIKSLTIITNLRMDVQRLFKLLRVVSALDYFQLRAENHHKDFRVELDRFLEERFPRIQKRIRTSVVVGS